ncbi:hypothetical protein [Candidatus Palauibacter soopunensis]|uniref:anti-sigma factor family protein n=1 Tax=Candidatus Palauibacter soopunensis TaxID=3056739 RepID=UPI0023A711F3|nr:hypothetical protein [Candidatus Palauibacter soopunensis]MDE2877480.1 hypothetical protein [Candidatus Palauibacter soopunensis]
MANHMDAERISALLDEPWADRDCRVHLEACGDCQAEFERLSRLRMALSALPDEKAPAGQWTAIEAALDAGETRAGVRRIGGGLAGRLFVRGPLQAAAALILFAGGVVAGLQFTGVRSANSPAADLADLPAVVSTDDGRALVDGLSRMESLRSPLRQVGDGGVNPASEGASSERDPLEMAQRLAMLEGYIRALRDQLETSPDDPFASAYLLELVETRDRLAEELGRASGTRTW